MGGFGSGRQGGKNCTGDMFALDIRKIQRYGRLRGGPGSISIGNGHAAANPQATSISGRTRTR